MLTVFLLPATAHAAFPGQNGKIAFSTIQDDPDPGCYPACNAEIYSVNPDGTDFTRLTNDPAYDSRPAWSPDGQKIVFGRAPDGDFFGDVVTMNADGSGETVLGPGYDPSWSPDGSKIVFVDWDDTNCNLETVFTMNADGSGRSFLGCGARSRVFGPVWSPDGGLVAFAADGPGLDIYTVRSDGSNRVNQNNTEFLSESNPNWSPDGTKILYDSEDPESSIWSMNRDGSNQTNLTPGEPGGTNPAYSPDGKQIVFNAPIPFDGIQMMSANGGPATVVTSSGIDPDWQPIPINAYPRPAGATPLRVSLVTAYVECTAPNRTHGPPLDSESCNPPTRSSDHLTVGTADANGQVVRYEGYLRLNTILGIPSTTTDEADVGIDFFSKGVLTNGLAIYTGELRAEVRLRITDKDNTPHPGGPGAATTQDFTFDIDATCAVVSEPSPHSVCQTTTTADALIPGAIKEGRRSIWQLGQVVVYDGGPDGDSATADNTVFARQGLFIP